MAKLPPALQNVSECIHLNRAEARLLYKGYGGTPSKESAKQLKHAFRLSWWLFEDTHIKTTFSTQITQNRIVCKYHVVVIVSVGMMGVLGHL